MDDRRPDPLVGADWLHPCLTDGSLDNHAIDLIKVIGAVAAVSHRFYAEGHHHKAFR
jgi:hypothetical protein